MEQKWLAVTKLHVVKLPQFEASRVVEVRKLIK